MRLGVFSDLHLEFAPWEAKAEPGVYYINAGDTHPYDTNRRLFDQAFFGEAMMNYHSRRVSTMGNHDFYGGDFPLVGANHTIKILEDRITVASATLWTSLPTMGDYMDYVDALVDHRFINQMTHMKYQEAHLADKKFLFESDADVIVSHHSPCMKSCHPKWGDSPFNRFFHNDFEAEILAMKKPPKLWIHGHTHDPSDYMIGATRVICNPRGYPSEINHADYKPVYIDL